MERGTPVVFVDRGAGVHSGCSVAVDDVLGGRLAVEHLVERGHRRIAFVGGPVSIHQVADRRAGFTAAIGSAAEVCHCGHSKLDCRVGPGGGRPACRPAGGGAPDGRVLRQRPARARRAAGDDAARHPRAATTWRIVGYDDIEFAAAAAVPLSSVRQPREHLGRTATEMLLEEIEDGDRHEHRHVVFQPDLVVRESSTRRRKSR